VLFWAVAGLALGWWLFVLYGRHPVPPDLARTLWVASALGVLALAIGQYLAWFGQFGYAVEGFLLSPNILRLATGLALGYWASRYRGPIGVRLGRFYAALLGGGEKSSWALQSAVAILVLFLIVLAMSPDLLEHLESFKAGEVEAKFSSISTTTGEAARVALNPLTNEIGITQWVDFKRDYRGESPRNKALELFDNSTIKRERVGIRDFLFDNYIEPLAISLACLEENDLLTPERRNSSFVNLAVSLRNAVVEEIDAPPAKSLFDEGKLHRLLRMINQELVSIDKTIRAQIPRSAPEETCKKFWAQAGNPKVDAPMMMDGDEADGRAENTNNVPAEMHELYREWVKTNALNGRIDVVTDRDAKELLKCFERAAQRLDRVKEERTYKLSLVDPYIVGAVSDLLALTLGKNEKANFLTLVKSKYPTEMKFFQPGLVNLYYQLSDAKNAVETPWPLDERIEDLSQAIKSIDYVIFESRKKLSEAKEKASDMTAVGSPGEPLPPKVKSCDPVPEQLAFAPENYAQIIEVYFTVKFYVINKFLEMYFSRSLAGDSLPDHDRLRWADFYRQLESVLNNNGAVVKLEAANWGSYSIPAEDLPFWRSALSQIEQKHLDQLFDAGIGMALSSIMLTENKTHRSPSQACAIAHHYLSGARDLIKSMRTTFDDAERDHLQGYTLQVEVRIGASCS
jgi:hypothetical protein